MGRLSQAGKVLVAIFLALLVFSVAGRISPLLVTLFNPFSWVVLYFSLVRDEVFGAITGTLCGLLQDTFSLGVFGIAGLTKTTLGFSAGLIGRKINILPPGRTFLFLFLLAAAELLLWKALAVFLFGEKLGLMEGVLFFQPVVTAAVVTILFQLIGRKKEEAA